MNGFEKKICWLCQGVKAIDDGGDGSKTDEMKTRRIETGLFYEAPAVLNSL